MPSIVLNILYILAHLILLTKSMMEVQLLSPLLEKFRSSGIRILGNFAETLRRLPLVTQLIVWALRFEPKFRVCTLNYRATWKAYHHLFSYVIFVLKCLLVFSSNKSTVSKLHFKTRGLIFLEISLNIFSFFSVN